MDAPRPASYTMADYLGMLRRHWWIVLLGAVLGLTAAYAWTARQPKVYESTTAVLVHPTGNTDANVVGGRTKGDINLDTEAQLVRSTAVAVEAGKLLRIDAPPDALARRVSVEVPANTSVLVVRFSGHSRRDAQAGSHAFAEAYLRHRENSARADLAEQTATLDAKLKQLNTTLAQLNTRIANANRDSSERENLESQRTTALNQINTLSGRLNHLTTATISPGKIISDARLPRRPTRPSVPLNLGTGLMIGVLGGLGVAATRERLTRRVRGAADVPRRAGVPVLAELPAHVPPRFDDVYPPYGPGGRTFNRLRNEVLASLRNSSTVGPSAPPEGPTVEELRRRPRDQVVLVTGASRGAGATLVAANLAAALARTGSEVVLVAAHLPDTLTDTASITRILGVSALPGLSDVLAGRVDLGEALQRAPRNPWLRVIPTGGTASAAGLLQSQTLRDTLAALRARAEYVVIEAPSTSISADAQSLAGLADAAIVVVEVRRTGHAEVADAAEQLHRIGTPLLGAVVLPRLRPAATEPPAPQPGQPAGPGAGVVWTEEHRSEATGATREDGAIEAPGPARAEASARPTESTVVFKKLDRSTLAALDRANGRPPAPDDEAGP